MTERPARIPNRGGFNRNIQGSEDRDYNPQVLRNLNKFYTDQNEKRKGLFERKNYCDPSDYEVLGGQEEPPSHITVTHTLPLATNINNFLLPSVTSVQLIAVGDLRLGHFLLYFLLYFNYLRSTNIENSPVIYAHTASAHQQVLYDALRAREEVDISYATSCYNGRPTV